MKLFRVTFNAVISALEQIFVEHKYADKVIEKVLKQNSKWGARDRRFIAETTYEVVRWKRLLQEISSSHENDFMKQVFAYLVIHDVRLPDWDDAKHINPKKIKERYERLKQVRKIRESIPDWLDEVGEKELGKAWQAEIHALNQQAPVVLRANSLKTSVDKLQEILAEDEVETFYDKHYPDALILKYRQNIFRHEAFKNGLFEVQDASSQLVAYYLDARPGMRVIDACAGAGGKTLHLSALLQNKGKVIAMDSVQWKLDELKKRARRAGAGNIETKLVENTKTIKRLENTADRLLLDVPCSGLGVLRRNPDAKWKLTPEFIDKVKQMQKDILANYPVMLKKGGVMVYSTCSILPSENEQQVQSFLKENPSFELIKEKKISATEGFDGFYMTAIRKR